MPLQLKGTLQHYITLQHNATHRNTHAPAHELMHVNAFEQAVINYNGIEQYQLSSACLCAMTHSHARYDSFICVT